MFKPCWVYRNKSNLSTEIASWKITMWNSHNRCAIQSYSGMSATRDHQRELGWKNTWKFAVGMSTYRSCNPYWNWHGHQSNSKTSRPSEATTPSHANTCSFQKQQALRYIKFNPHNKSAYLNPWFTPITAHNGREAVGCGWVSSRPCPLHNLDTASAPLAKSDLPNSGTKKCRAISWHNSLTTSTIDETW